MFWEKGSKRVVYVKIAFDVDNVLADTMSRWCTKATEYLSSPIIKKDIKSHKIVGSVPLPPRIIFRLLDQVWYEWEDLPPIESDLTEKIGILRDNDFVICIATSRPLRSIQYVKQWLDKMEICYDEFYSLGPYKLKANTTIDALVDDAPDQIRRFVHTGRIGFLYKQPWNKKAKIRKAIVIDSLDDILKYYKLTKRYQ